MLMVLRDIPCRALGVTIHTDTGATPRPMPAAGLWTFSPHARNLRATSNGVEAATQAALDAATP